MNFLIAREIGAPSTRSARVEKFFTHQIAWAFGTARQRPGVRRPSAAFSSRSKTRKAAESRRTFQEASWTAVAERSGDTAFAGTERNQVPTVSVRAKAAWCFASNRTSELRGISRLATTCGDTFIKALALTTPLLLAVFLTFSPTATLRAADDDRPVVDASKLAAEKAANTKLPTLHLVGDSTVKAGGSGAGLIGWGERIKPFFNTNKLNVVNDAIGGRSARTYFNEGRWQRVAAAIKPGDFVTIQFGHNDQGRIGDPANKHRADGPGIGDETADDVFTNGTTEAVHTFGWYMSKFVSDAKVHGATVIVCAPIPHKQRWETGRDFEALAGWDKQVAQTNGVLFLDLTLVITDAYKKVGAEKVETFFADKGTHTSDAGAQFNAACVVAGLKSLPGNPLGNFFSDQGNAIEPYKPSAENSTNTPAKTE